MNEMKQPIVWFNKGDFEMNNPVCDACSDPLTGFPVAIRGSHALCKSCQSEIGISPGDNEYFESFNYNCDLEPKQLGVNCGGRYNPELEEEIPGIKKGG